MLLEKPVYECSVKSFNILAHLSWKLKWAFLITCCLMSVCLSVCLSVRPPVCKLFTFLSSYPEPLGKFQPNLTQSIPGWRDSSLFKWRATPFPKRRWLGNNKNKLTTFKNLLLQNHWASFNQTWHKVSRGERDSSFFKWRAMPFSRGR